MRSTRFVAVVVVGMVGCSDTPPSVSEGNSQQSLTSTPVTLADPFASPTQWSAASGYYFGGARLVSDLSGDGVTDAIVSVCADSSDCSWHIVHGPLRRELTLPGEEVAVLPSGIAAPLTIGDVTGDGVPDLEVPPDEGGRMWLPGPFAGSVSLTIGRDWGGYPVDVNDDGILDLATFGPPGSMEPRLEVRYGPTSRWEGAADIIVDPSCGDELSMNDFTAVPPSVHPDFTGDGVREFDVAAYGYADHCRGWVFPVPGPGIYDPFVDPNAVTIVTSFTVVPDQTGDGLADAIFSGTPDTLVEAPLSFTPDGVASGVAVLADIPATLLALYPMTFDLNDDGISDFLAKTSIDEGQSLAGTSVIFGGPTALDAGQTGGTWSGLAAEAFLEDGVASMLVYRNDSVAIVDLGSGSLVE